jgi:hypothetical protein
MTQEAPLMPSEEGMGFHPHHPCRPQRKRRSAPSATPPWLRKWPAARPKPTTTPLAKTAQKSFPAVPPWHCRHTAIGDLQPGATIYASMAYQENQSRRQPRHHDATNKPQTLDNLNINDEGRCRRPPTAATGAAGGRPPTSVVGAATGEASTTARVPTATAPTARQSMAPDPTTATVPSRVPATHAARGVAAHRTAPPPPPEPALRHRRCTPTREPPRRQIRRRMMQIPRSHGWIRPPEPQASPPWSPPCRA